MRHEAFSLFRELLADDANAPEAWRAFHAALSQHYDQFSAALGRHLSGDELFHMLQLLLIPVARNGFLTEERKNRLFDEAQSMGIHILPLHFYSPVPDTRALADTLWSRRYDGTPALSLNPDAQLGLMARLAPFAEELRDVPEDAGAPGEFFWNNGAFGPFDAITYYTLIRASAPRRIVEIGAGYSTMLAARAARRNGGTLLRCIDPFPMEGLRAVDGLAEIIASTVQDVPLQTFEDLRPHDILFVDSTHVSKTGSDVNHIMFEIVPRLPAGVLIHFHDIMLPCEYPKWWVVDRKIFWNESYLIMAFLMFNTALEVVLSNYYLGSDHRARLRELFPWARVHGGVSLWIRRV